MKTILSLYVFLNLARSMVVMKTPSDKIRRSGSPFGSSQWSSPESIERKKREPLMPFSSSSSSTATVDKSTLILGDWSSPEKMSDDEGNASSSLTGAPKVLFFTPFGPVCQE